MSADVLIKHRTIVHKKPKNFRNVIVKELVLYEFNLPAGEGKNFLRQEKQEHVDNGMFAENVLR